MAKGAFENITLYRELLAGFTTRIHDLNWWQRAVIVEPGPTTAAYHAGQALACDVFVSGGNGLLYPSARYRSGRCLSAPRPLLIQKVRQGSR